MNKKIRSKMKTKKLYHITLGTTTELSPRIPKNKLKGEDGVTERICVCPTIEDCFRAVSWGVRYYDKPKYEGLDRELVRVLEFDVNDIGLENIVDNNFIVRNSLVPDALDTNEFWIINKTIKPSAVYYIYPQSMDYALLMGGDGIGVELYSYLKIKEGVISEDIVKSLNGKLYPWELGIKEEDVSFIEVKPAFRITW